MNTLFKTNDERKRRRCDKSIHKVMRNPVEIHKTKKKFSVTFQTKNVRKLEFADHLWIPFIDQTRSDIVFFAIITFHIYNILVTKWKHGIGPNDVIIFNK